MLHGPVVLAKLTMRALLDWFRGSRLRVAAGLLTAIISASLGIAWFMMGATRTGPVSFWFEAVSVEVEAGAKTVLEPDLLANALTAVTGNASSLKFDPCNSPCAGPATGISLHRNERSSPLGLSSLTWDATSCGPTTLLLSPAAPAWVAELTSQQSGCGARALLMLGEHAGELTYNPSTTTTVLSPRAKVAWRASGPISLNLRAWTGPLLSRSTRVEAIVGRLREPLPGFSGITGRSICQFDRGDTIRLSRESWQFSAIRLAGDGVTLEATALHDDATRCTGAPTRELASCRESRNVCQFDRKRLWEESKLPGAFGLFMSLISFGGSAASGALRRRVARRDATKSRSARLWRQRGPGWKRRD